MKNIPLMIDGQTSLLADDFNQIPGELENSITGSGQALNGGDLNQLGKALTKSCCAYDFYEDTGTVNSIVLNSVGHQPLLSYTNGLRVRFHTSNSNTGATTVNIDGIGIKDLVNLNNPTNYLSKGYIESNQYYNIIYNTSIDKFIIQKSGIGLDIWEGRESIVYTDPRDPYIGTSTASIDLTNISMINEDETVSIFDLSTKKYIYYSFDFEFQMEGSDTEGGRDGSITINRNNSNGINLLKSKGFFSTSTNNFNLLQSAYSTAILDVKGNIEVFLINRTGKNIAGIYTDNISILGWID